jgi:hypothetical protein
MLAQKAREVHMSVSKSDLAPLCDRVMNMALNGNCNALVHDPTTTMPGLSLRRA